MIRILLLSGLLVVLPLPALAGGLLQGGQSKGFVLGLHGKADGYTYDRELRQIAEMGAGSVLIIVTCYQEDASSTTMANSNNGVPSRERLVDILNRAHAYGLDVLLQPIVLLKNPKSTKDWRGSIRPDSRKEWFANYENFITYFAAIARDTNTEALSVGSEFVSLEFFRESWVDVIDKVRAIFPGKLIYSANWDHYEEVTFWDKLDAVGVTSYHNLSKSDNPESSELVSSWRSIRNKLLSWQKKIGKPLIFTEIGYPSQKGAAREPWNYYGSTTVDLNLQKACLQAFLDVWTNTPEVAAFFIFEWWDDGGPNDVGYCPWGKPAEPLLRTWFLSP
ncbi:MAG: hypothetical protein V2A58_05500 [Planctomycetota bacterium]